MQIVLLVVGVALGGLVGWALAQSKAKTDAAALRTDLVRANAERDAALEKTATLQSTFEEQLARLPETFENLSQRVLDKTSAKLEEEQARLAALRAEKIDEKLNPLSASLTNYERSLLEFNQQRQQQLSDLKAATERLMNEQQGVRAQTDRLATLLGRSDNRGRWGEIQLENILRVSDLREHDDYTMQHTHDDRRPDCIVHLPNRTELVIDAKFPYDAFEAGLDATDPAEKEAHFKRHAEALKNHVKALSDKSYYDLFTATPEMVVMFLPSDYALGAALEADRDLYQFALSRRVVVAGPSSLISILWAVALVMRQYHANQNLEEVATSASEMYARVQTLVGHIVKMGSSLDSAVEHYNKFLGSMETRVIVQANRLRELRATSSAEPIREVTPIDKVPQHINPARWEEAGLDLDSLTSERVIDVTGDERELGE